MGYARKDVEKKEISKEICPLHESQKQSETNDQEQLSLYV